MEGYKPQDFSFFHCSEKLVQQQKDEQKGFEAILEGLCNMFRNPLAHQPKIEWSINEQDALEILSLISYCHRRLDNAVRIGD